MGSIARVEMNHDAMEYRGIKIIREETVHYPSRNSEENDLLTINQKVSWVRMHLDAWGRRGVKITIGKNGKIIVDPDIYKCLSQEERMVINKYISG